MITGGRTWKHLLIVRVLSGQSLSNIFLGGNCRQRFRAARSRSAKIRAVYCTCKSTREGGEEEEEEERSEGREKWKEISEEVYTVGCTRTILTYVSTYST